MKSEFKKINILNCEGQFFFAFTGRPGFEMAKRQVYTDSITITIKCGKCGHEFEIPGNELRGWEAECELCGGHGGVDLSTVCPQCKRNINIELNSW